MNDTEFKKLLGKRIKDLRTKRGMTQEKLAELIDVGERNLSKLECGEIFVKASTVTKILEAFEIKPNELFDFSNYQPDNNIKETLINAINSDLVDVDLLFRIYRSIKY